jgi:hypothetical protein
MPPVQLQRTYLDLTTPHVADACTRLGIPLRCAPAGTRPLWIGTHVVGRVSPAPPVLAALRVAAPGCEFRLMPDCYDLG